MDLRAFAESMKEDFSSFVSDTLPNLLITIIVVLIAIVCIFKFVPQLRPRPLVYTFDIVKFSNAQKRFSTALMQNPYNSDLTTLVTGMGSKTRAMIKQIAGKDAIILIKQSVVNEDVPDITDQVLVALGLPTDVPTVKLQNSFESERYNLFDADGKLLPNNMVNTMAAAASAVESNPNKDLLP